ncbi:Ig-like domain-containing protein [Marinilabilia sp.]|uniref:Ig-like domain-containing protein n=1 Tax=Marinilabilia sp. TaxID=2021252 RepID=UPI0025BBAF46|nr:Ig-like domain-containing protein [Marinilabilia sp.]
MKKLVLLLILIMSGLIASAQTSEEHSVPFSTDSAHLTIWNGSEYIPFFLKGMNLGVAVPGTFPGQIAASREQYASWFEDIKEAGFNNIRLYTLHYPRFYEVLDSFNLANSENPLLFFQGVWLNEALPGYEDDLYFMTDTFRVEMEENIDCVHGNRVISVRQGKAFGDYTHDVSQWCLGYIIGREIHPGEVLTTNENHSAETRFEGEHFSITDASPAEVWFTEKLDHLVGYEFQNYNTQRPVSVSSWPTLDPLAHPEEGNEYEDSASLDFSKIEVKYAPAGMFISYHAYPYYPDFISMQSNYLEYSDQYGLNSYLGYLTELKSHYHRFPVIIAEYGVPSSWGIAHYATSGMNQGGFDEQNQGETNIRMLRTMEQSGCGGGIQFAWIDEWFKPTWITDPVDYDPQSRILWHNVTAAEQNYGLLKFEKTKMVTSLSTFDETSAITELKAEINYAFFELEIGLKNPLDIPDEMWVTFDTYGENLGESLLPNGVEIPSRAEFYLHITNHSANLYVTEAYDIYGIWHGVSEPEQQFRSVSTDGAPWYIVRWKNNYSHSDVQYIGSLQFNYGFQNASSKDAVTLYDDKIAVRIPWSLLNVVAPDKRIVLHDDRRTPETEDMVSDGFRIAAYYHSQWYDTEQRFAWETWNSIDTETISETKKASFQVMKDRLPDFNSSAIAVLDSFDFTNDIFPVVVNTGEGVLKNDFDIDGNFLVSLMSEPPVHGTVELHSDGSFIYQAKRGFSGFDTFKYCLFDGYSLSQPNFVVLKVAGSKTDYEDGASDGKELLEVYPNPTSGKIYIKTAVVFEEIMVFAPSGALLETHTPTTKNFDIDLSRFKPGIFLIVAKWEDEYISKKVMKD